MNSTKPKPTQQAKHPNKTFVKKVVFPQLQVNKAQFDKRVIELLKEYQTKKPSGVFF